jgi:hypothetical protein
LHAVQQRRDDARAGCADRMAERHRPAAHVHALERQVVGERKLTGSSRKSNASTFRK